MSATNSFRAKHPTEDLRLAFVWHDGQAHCAVHEPQPTSDQASLNNLGLHAVLLCRHGIGDRPQRAARSALSRAVRLVRADRGVDHRRCHLCPRRGAGRFRAGAPLAGTFRGDAPFDAWVWRIVVKAAHDPRPDTREGLHVEPAPPENGSTGEFASWLALLPERQRLAVFLRYAADLDYRSIALVLDVKVGTVSATLHAAHERLRPSIEEARR